MINKFDVSMNSKPTLSSASVDPIVVRHLASILDSKIENTISNRFEGWVGKITAPDGTVLKVDFTVEYPDG